MKHIGMIPAALLLALGCNREDYIVLRDKGFGGPESPESPVVPTGPLHIAFEGIYDAYIPVNLADAQLVFDAHLDPPAAAISVRVPEPSSVHIAIIGNFRPSSADEVVTLDQFSDQYASLEGDGIYASLNGVRYPFTALTADFSSEGIQLQGVATIEGAERAILLEGPLYRCCAVKGSPPGWTQPEPEPNLEGTWEGAVAPPTAWCDTKFTTPECAPFR
jgi:hypothetical protein